MFATIQTAREAFANAKTAADFLAARRVIGKAISELESDAHAIYTNGPRVHGAAQASKLDLLSKWTSEAYALFDRAQAAWMAAR